MRRVEEVIYIVPEQREAYLYHMLNPTQETLQVYWMHGVRNQYYFQLNNYILMTFTYQGNNFKKDMVELSAYLAAKGLLIQKRRKDVQPDRLMEENWWAPVKRLGYLLSENPMPESKEEEQDLEGMYHEMISGYMSEESGNEDIYYNDDDWSESLHM